MRCFYETRIHTLFKDRCNSNRNPRSCYVHFLVPKIGNFAAELYPDIAYIKYLVFINLYATALPYYFALYQTFKLLNYIDKNNAFSELSVQALKNIKYSALAISVLYVLGMPLFISWQREMMPWHYYYRNDYDFFFNGNRGLCRRSPKTIKRCYRYKIRK